MTVDQAFSDEKNSVLEDGWMRSIEAAVETAGEPGL